MIFKYSQYKKFLEYVISVCNIFPLRVWQGQKGVILRHDVDLDIEPAYRLMKVEQEAGVYSSFFILTTCHTYNIASKKNRTMLREMADAGFEVGLHFDPMIYDKLSVDDLSRMVRKEADVLADVVGHKVVSVSLHRPSIYQQYPLFPDFLNAYDSVIFNEGVYMSDSRMILRQSPYDFVSDAKDKIKQLLLHPLHFTPDGGDYRIIMHRYARRFLNEIDEDFSIGNQTYARDIGKGAVDLLVPNELSN